MLCSGVLWPPKMLYVLLLEWFLFGLACLGRETVVLNLWNVSIWTISASLVDIQLLFSLWKASFFFLEINSAMTGFYDDVITTMLFRACRVLIYCLKSFHMLHIFLLAVYSYAAGCCAIDQVQPSCLLNYQCNISSNHIFCEWPLKLYLWLGTSGIILIPEFSTWVSHRL